MAGVAVGFILLALLHEAKHATHPLGRLFQPLKILAVQERYVVFIIGGGGWGEMSHPGP